MFYKRKFLNKQLNILFLTMLDFDSLEQSNIYTDLLQEFKSNNHNLYVVSPVEKKNWKKFRIINENNVLIIKPRIGNYQKTNMIEKGITSLFLEKRILKALKNNCKNVKFDLILYSTPPINFAKCISYIKKRDNAKTYLLLKDIFPQNSIDLGILSKKGIKGIIYKYFRNKEIILYGLSDYIGCMSEANVDYLLKHNSYISPDIVEINPNTEQEQIIEYDYYDKDSIFKNFNIPQNKKIFIYGGNLGRPQGIDFLLECINENELNDNSIFVIVGSGTEYKRIENHIKTNIIKNTMLLPHQSKEIFNKLVYFSDVGLIFLDYRFSIPNFPSRLLTYMKQKKPVLIACDSATDIGKIAKDNGFGDYCFSNDIKSFNFLMNKFINEFNLEKMGQKSYEFFKNNYISKLSYEKIINKYWS